MRSSQRARADRYPADPPPQWAVVESRERHFSYLGRGASRLAPPPEQPLAEIVGVDLRVVRFGKAELLFQRFCRVGIREQGQLLRLF